MPRSTPLLDPEAGPLYEVESHFAYYLSLQPLSDLNEVTSFVDNVVNSPAVRAKFPIQPHPIYVTTRRNTPRESLLYSFPGTIYLPRPLHKYQFALDPALIVHEIAHHFTYHTYGTDIDPHGHEYRSTHLELISLLPIYPYSAAPILASMYSEKNLTYTRSAFAAA